MAEERLHNFRLSLMQDFLPVGFAVAKRIRKGGANKVFEAFSKSNDPLKDLRLEGESEATALREKLDQVSPGLGNPVIPVTIDVTDDLQDQEGDALRQFLQNLEVRLDRLQSLSSELDNNDEQFSNTTAKG